MGKRAGPACQPPEITQRPRRRRKTTPGDAAPCLSTCGCSSGATSHAERRPRQRKNPNPARRLRRSCATDIAQACRLGRALSAASWVAKRPRTVRFGPAVGSRWRDWAGLDEGPAGLIADRVLANDVADYVRFRAACLPWRRCCADPRARGVLEDPRLYPRHWIMLCDDYERLAAAPHRSTRRRFLNTSTGQCVRVDVPELRDHDVLRATADGLLVLHRKTSKAIRVLNPLTRQTAELPPPATGFECTPCSAGLLDHGTVYLYSYGKMAIARPGDDRWALLDAGSERLMSTVFFNGRFYGVTTTSGIVTVDMAGGGGGPRLVVAAELPKPFPFRSMTDNVHLMDNGDGDLRLVHRMRRPIREYDGEYTYKRMYRVYRVNLSTGKTTNRGRHNLRARAIFIDLYCGLSVSPWVFPFLSTDTIYLGLHCSERSVIYGYIGAYHVRDGSIEPPCNDDGQRRGLARPLSIADSLIAYVTA